MDLERCPVVLFVGSPKLFFLQSQNGPIGTQGRSGVGTCFGKKHMRFIAVVNPGAIFRVGKNVHRRIAQRIPILLIDGENKIVIIGFVVGSFIRLRAA